MYSAFFFLYPFDPHLLPVLSQFLKKEKGERDFYVFFFSQRHAFLGLKTVLCVLASEKLASVGGMEKRLYDFFT